MTLIPVTSLSDTSHPVAMLLTVIHNGTFCTTTMAYFGGSEGEQAITHGLLEVTSPEAALTGNDVT
jgi:hypothetical protein